MKRIIYIITLISIFVATTNAQRSIPDDNLAYPVFILLTNGSSGTGFFINSKSGTYLVTCKHVLFDRKNKLLSNKGDFFSSSKNLQDKTQNHFQINLKYMYENNLLKYNPKYDIAILKIGTILALDSLQHQINLFDSVKVISSSKSGIVGVNERDIKMYDEVLVANDIYIFGYPTSLGIPESPQFDYFKPLLRKGIIAGKYDDLKTIILDCPVYFGNSGGPVLQSTFKGFGGFEFNVIGVVLEFIPFAETWVNATQQYSNISISNSGYSVCVSMDVVLEMLK